MFALVFIVVFFATILSNISKMKWNNLEKKQWLKKKEK